MPLPDSNVIDALSASLRMHWTAIEFYESQSAWIAPAFPKLGAKIAEHAAKERWHAREMLDRLRFYEEPAVFDHDEPTGVSPTFTGFLDAALEIETKAAGLERSGVLMSRDVGDELSALAFARLLAGSESSILEIDGIRAAIAEIGIGGYLAAFV
jgi:bacterioferritin (cytochrome b1)